MLTAGQNATQHGKAIILQLKISQFLKKPFLNDLLCIGQGAESVRVQSEPKPEPRPQTDGTAKWGNLRRISFKKKKKNRQKTSRRAVGGVGETYGMHLVSGQAGETSTGRGGAGWSANLDTPGVPSPCRPGLPAPLRPPWAGLGRQ